MSDQPEGRDARQERIDRLNNLRQLPSTPSAEEVAPPLHWPSMRAIDAERHWPVLVSWVEEMRTRYEEFDTHVVPRCWYRHPSIVGALQALKDHERVSYSTGAPGAAGTDWHRAYRDMTLLLKQFTAKLECARDHAEFPQRPPIDAEDFHEAVAADLANRRQIAAKRAAAS